ncbi:MAG: DUF1015 domain-containing protein, partial [Oscillospiraceae bacterium]|nr:DUF1015 domain-containing protein [Oscillospiraceae bacterium]
MNKIFKRAEILLPKSNPEKWAVIACDQFTSSPEYWEKLSEETKGCPSALNIIFPEVYLSTVDNAKKAEEINSVMGEYLRQDVFTVLPDSYVFVKRTLPSGKVRRGIVGALDLDAYDYKAGSASPVRCTEGTIESRLPPRLAIRKDAPLELPHILVFYDDPEGKINSLMEKLSEGETPSYDCDLLAGGGHIRGFEISGEKADSFEALTGEMYSEDKLRERFGGLAPVIFAMGDGNHSLATAKLCRVKKIEELGREAAEYDPSRYALVELVNIHDEAIGFEPIHRVMFNVDADKAASALKSGLCDISLPEGEEKEIAL